VGSMLLVSEVQAQPAPLFTWGSTGAAVGQFNHPFGLAFDSQSNVYVADYDNNRVQKFNADGDYLATIGVGALDRPIGVALTAGGDLLVSDHFGCFLRKFSADGSLIQVLAGPGSGPGQLSYPVGVALDRDENIYVASSNTNQVDKFTATGSFLASWQGQLSSPYGVAVDAQGVVYVSDKDNHRVQKFTADGAFIGYLGEALLNSPDGLSLDADGGVLVADYGQRVIVKLSVSGALVYTLGLPGTAAEQFVAGSPADVRVAPNGRMYATDWDHNRIHVFGNSGPPPQTSGSLCGEAGEGWPLTLTAPAGMVLLSIDFASYGTPTGTCGAYALSNCHTPTAKAVLEAACLGRNGCTVLASNSSFGDPCFGTVKWLRVQASYGSAPTPTRRTSWGSVKTIYR